MPRIDHGDEVAAGAPFGRMRKTTLGLALLSLEVAALVVGGCDGDDGAGSTGTVLDASSAEASAPAPPSDAGSRDAADAAVDAPAPKGALSVRIASAGVIAGRVAFHRSDGPVIVKPIGPDETVTFEATAGGNVTVGWAAPGHVFLYSFIDAQVGDKLVASSGGPPIPSRPATARVQPFDAGRLEVQTCAGVWAASSSEYLTSDVSGYCVDGARQAKLLAVARTDDDGRPLAFAPLEATFPVDAGPLALDFPAWQVTPEASLSSANAEVDAAGYDLGVFALAGAAGAFPLLSASSATLPPTMMFRRPPITFAGREVFVHGVRFAPPSPALDSRVWRIQRHAATPAAPLVADFAKLAPHFVEASASGAPSPTFTWKLSGPAPTGIFWALAQGTAQRDGASPTAMSWVVVAPSLAASSGSLTVPAIPVSDAPAELAIAKWSLGSVATFGGQLAPDYALVRQSPEEWLGPIITAPVLGDLGRLEGDVDGSLATARPPLL